MSSPGSEDPQWADPGYFAHKSRIANGFRLFWQLIRPPRGHRTLPTKAGMLLILVSLGIGTAAFNTSHNILYIALALLLSSLLLSGVLSWMNFKGCRWRLKVEPHWRAEEPTPVVVEVSNTKEWLPTYGLWFRLRATTSELETMLPQYGRLAPQQTTELEWLYTPAERGRETLVLRGVLSRFPFGFLRKSIDHSYSCEVVVWPARISYTFNRTKARANLRSGSWHSRPGAGTELLNLREYRAGDPLRTVHWKASARQQKLLVREMAEESAAQFCLVLSTRAGQWVNAAQFEKLCSFVGSLAEDLFMADSLGAVVIDANPPIMVRRIADLHAFLSELAVLSPSEHAANASELPPRRLIPLTFKPGLGESVTCLIDGEYAGEA